MTTKEIKEHLKNPSETPKVERITTKLEHYATSNFVLLTTSNRVLEACHAMLFNRNTDTPK